MIQDFARFIDGILLLAMKIMAATYSFVCAGTPATKPKTEDKKRVSRVQSLRSTDIQNNLMHKDVVQLSDGLARLEELLKSGIND